MTIDRLRHILRLRLRSLFSGASADRELDEELRFHVDRQIETHVARGVSPEDARLLALRAIGGVEQRKEQMRDARGISPIENLARDLRLALRQLRKQPGFAVTAIVSLALGIGANTAMFQLLNALTLRTLPVRAPQELAEIRLTGDGRDGRHTGRNRQVSLPQYLEIERHQQAFQSLLAFGDTRFNLSAAGEVRYVDGLWVSGTFFETLGVQPLLGRLIAPADDRKGCGSNTVAVISYALWQAEFGGRHDILGQTIPFADSRVPIIGVTPQSFYGVEVGRRFGVAMPICASGFGANDHWWLAAIGRLKPGWTTDSATAQLSQVFPSIQQATMPNYRPALADSYLRMGITIVDASAGLSPLRQSYRAPLWILMAIAGLVLLMAAVNLANLLLARATARRSEFAVRLAVGGSRGRVLQQVLVESALLAVLGSVAALAVAFAVSQSIPPLISTVVDRIYLDLAIDWRVFGFTTALAVLTALIFGSAPAVRASRASLRPGSERGGAGNDGLRFRRALVAVQLAVTLVLLFGGLLFLRTFQNLSALDTGVGHRGVVVASVFFTDRQYPEARRQDAYRALDERIFALPGVRSAAEAYTTPMGGNIWDTDIVTDRREQGTSYGNRVSPRYFETLGTPILAGRDFDARDVPGAGLVAIVNQAFASKYYDGRAVGRHFTIPSDSGGPGEQYEIIGIVGDQKYLDLRVRHERIMFTASAQLRSLPTVRRYVIRASGTPRETMTAVGAAVDAFDRDLDVRYAVLDTQIEEGMLRERLMARLSAIFGGVALLLAIVGLYGVMSYSVASRRAEIGVRVALGATRTRILRLVLADAGRMMIAGLAAGIVLALIVSRAVGSLLYDLNPHDPATLMLSAGLLVVAGLLSAAWPARRAASVDPTSALRES